MLEQSVIIKPIKDVIDFKSIKDEVNYEYAQLLASAKPMKTNLLIIPNNNNHSKGPTPSLLTLNCVVAMMMKVKLGLIVDKEILKNMAIGTVVHRHYEAWFKSANKHLTVYSEMMLNNGELVGSPDLVYCNKNQCGLIELKATWMLNDEKEQRYVMQMAIYYDMLREFNITEAYLVTMSNVKLIPIRELENNVSKAKQLLNEAKGNYPPYPPDPRKCVNCILRPVCPSHKNLMDKLLFGQ